MALILQHYGHGVLGHKDHSLSFDPDAGNIGKRAEQPALVTAVFPSTKSLWLLERAQGVCTGCMYRIFMYRVYVQSVRTGFMYRVCMYRVYVHRVYVSMWSTAVHVHMWGI